MSQRRFAVHFVLVLLFVSTFAVPALTSTTVPAGASILGPSQYDYSLVSQRSEVQASVEASANGSVDTRKQIATLHDERSRTRSVDGVQAIRADEVQARGITGQGVRVGVIGSAFDADNEVIAGQVAAERRAHPVRQLRNARTAHDTAVAEVVSRTAPGADLYLAGVGSSPTPESYAEAVEWLLEHDVDVIVDSGSYFPPTTGGMNRISAVAENASERGVVFVTSAGNYANRHWAGVADGDEWVSFAPDSEANVLNEGKATRGRVSLRLYWNSTADYDLYLYRRTRGSDPVVAKSVVRQRTGADASTAESIDVVVPKGVYYVGIYAHDDTEGAADAANETRTSGVADARETNGTHLRLFSTHNTLTYATARGSMVAPATSDKVITVGAIDAKSGLIREYSSRGYGEDDVDIDAPDGVSTSATGQFYGTSAAAPYVAGTAALVESQNGELSPTEIERILERTARDTGSGYQIDALAAVEAASSGNVTARTAAEP